MVPRSKGNILLTFLLGVVLCPRASSLTVHIVPHTHDDAGWLKTVDEYYSGTNDTIQHANVRNILNSVKTSLEKNPARKFTYVEQAFFQRWWRELGDDEKNETRALVRAGRLNFVNGGWCMHDEASTHYIDMVDQTTLGHRLLKEAFGDDGIVSIGWQLDPFGHSATQAALLSADAGFDGLFFGRIDYQDLTARHQTKRNEFLWRASPSLGNDNQVFAGLSGEYGGNYGPPPGFNWNGDDEPVEDNKNLQTYNVPERVAAAIQQAQIQGNMTRGNNIMWTMGSDFNYENAEAWFVNIDKLIEAVNADGRVHMQYSSPAEYVAAKRKEKDVTWPVTTGDFFPYADGPHQFWSGYFTSRPALKGYVRTTSALFGAVRFAQSIAIAKDPSWDSPSALPGSLELIEEALGLAQHHDAVSGTAKQHVTFDYARRLSRGVDRASAVFSDTLMSLRRRKSQKNSLRGDGNADGDSSYGMCPRLNETVCPLTQQTNEGSVEIVLWNALAHERNETITLPISSTSSVTVKNDEGIGVVAQVYESSETVTNYERGTNESQFVVSFLANMPPLGYSTYTLDFKPRVSTTSHVLSHAVLRARSTMTTPPVIENEFIAVKFSQNGLISSVTNKESGISVNLSQSFCYYVSSTGDKFSGQPSGAYIFRPKSDYCYPILNSDEGADIELTINGDIVKEVRQKFAPWLTQTVRLTPDARHVELEFTVGEVPFQATSLNQTMQQCVAWRQTGACDPYGPREPEKDMKCDEAVPGYASGYCECFGGRREQKSFCGHDGFTCKQACLFTEGHEVVSRFNTSIKSGGILLTDSNGREVLTRRRNYRPTWNFSNTEQVAGNYYPINSAAAITDSKESQLTVLVDRACGAGSIVDGELEFMIHRRIINDDNRGVGEPLNETKYIGSYAGQHKGMRSGPGLVIRGSHRLILHKPAYAARHWRPLADRIYSPPQMLVNLGDSDASSITKESFIGNALPPNVQLMTLQALSQKKLLLRLSHQFGIGEDSVQSKPVTFDLASVLASDVFKIKTIKEVSLTNSLSKEAVLSKREDNAAWRVEGGAVHAHPWRRSDTGLMKESSKASIVTLGPMEIKTFVVTLE